MCPHLNYHVQSWSLCLKKDLMEVEKAQKRAIKMIKEMEQLHKKRRLKILGLSILEKRKFRFMLK